MIRAVKMIKIDEDKCMGCQQCGDVCPAGAISYQINNGFAYPKVDPAKCIKCGLCVKRCPGLNEAGNAKSYPEVYAAWSRNAQRRIKSTSGGVCYELSKYIIDNGGYVAGVSWTDSFKSAQYELVHDYDGLERISQTKYFQPVVAGIYKEIKALLEQDKTVLFIGTACCGDALRRYLGKSYEGLYVCDFICRGYTSGLYHRKWVEALEKKYSSKVSMVQYKNKTRGWNSFGTYVEFENGKKLYVNRDDDPYEIMFQIDDYNTRPSCYECKYRKENRSSDITVGDFWGIQHTSPEDLKSGISVVLINSPKGKFLLEAAGDAVFYEKHEIYEVKKGNPAFVKNFERKEGADIFFDDLEKKSMRYIEKKYASRKKMGKMKRILAKLSNISKCSMLRFVYFNWFCKSVVRKKGKYIIPYKGTRLSIDKTARVYINDNLYLNAFKHKGSKEEAYIAVMKNAELIIDGRVTIAAKCTIDVCANARLKMGALHTNVGVTLVCSNIIEIGDDVQIGRNVLIYDSNYHSTNMSNINKLRPLLIGNHVWLCTGVTITKGVKIGNGAVCGINSTIMNNVKEKNMVLGNPAKVVMANMEWG